jgi:DNA-binding HxlR family transcriptional regulator
LARALTATGDHWTLAIVLELASGRMRLGQLQRCLPAVSAGVLDRHLTQMVSFDLIARERYREMPPRVEIELTESGRELIPIACALACWGMRFRWSEPDATELVDVDALLRMLPALLELTPDTPAGSVEAVLDESNHGSPQFARHVICYEDGRPRLARRTTADDAEMPAERVTTSMRGTREAWIAALGPAREYGRLEIGGDTVLAQKRLASLPNAG